MLSVYIGLFVFFQIGFLVYLFNKKLHTVDLLWGLAHGVVALGAWLFIDKPRGTLEVVFFGTVIAWSLRLYFYLLIRNWGKPDDRRYLDLASSWKGNTQINAYFRIFTTQMFLSAVTSLSVLFGLNGLSSKALEGIFILGFFLSLFGLIYESVADFQLYQFKKNNPHKRLYGIGLYKFSRHPNYFGEILFWWGVFIMAINLGAPWWVIVAPSTINWLIVNFSGVPFQKKKTEDQDFNNYVNSTNAIIPNFFKGQFK